MTKNLKAFIHQFESHFRKSPNSILEIGIQTLDETKIYTWNNPNQKTLFGLGSISKTIISTYVCDMIKRHELDLNQTIDHYLPLTKKRRYPTVLELLTHTSGYHAFIPLNPAVWVLLTHGFNKKNIYTKVDRDWLFHSVNTKRPFRKKKYRYSDYNYAVLAMIIETIEGRPYKEGILEYLQTTIGMHHTEYGSKELTSKDQASWIWQDDNPFLASGGLFSTTEDMLLFLSYQIEHADELKLSHSKYHRLNLNKNVFTGFSWNSFYNGKFYWHIGGQGYYRSYALFDYKKNIIVSILATVDINIQHVNRLGSSLYRNLKRNKSHIYDYLDSVFIEKEKNAVHIRTQLQE
jgi:CubicO group peptidase (beta-lactamase class C family)